MGTILQPKQATTYLILPMYKEGPPNPDLFWKNSKIQKIYHGEFDTNDWYWRDFEYQKLHRTYVIKLFTDDDSTDHYYPSIIYFSHDNPTMRYVKIKNVEFPDSFKKIPNDLYLNKIDGIGDNEEIPDNN